MSLTKPALAPNTFCATPQITFVKKITKRCWHHSGKVIGVAIHVNVATPSQALGPRGHNVGRVDPAQSSPRRAVASAGVGRPQEPNGLANATQSGAHVARIGTPSVSSILTTIVRGGFGGRTERVSAPRRGSPKHSFGGGRGGRTR